MINKFSKIENMIKEKEVISNEMIESLVSEFYLKLVSSQQSNEFLKVLRNNPELAKDSCASNIENFIQSYCKDKSLDIHSFKGREKIIADKVFDYLKKWLKNETVV